MKNITIDGIEYMPVPKSEPVKQGYEIMSFRIGISIWPINPRGNYEIGGHAPIFNLNKMLEFVKGNSCTIESVKRLSDGDVFSVGDNLGSTGNVIKIELIEISGVLGIVLYFKHSFVLLQYAEKVKQPAILLTTEDGVEITDKEQEVFICDTNFFKGIMSAKNIPDSLSGVAFSTEAARDEYILHNKPITTTLKEYIESPFLTVAFFKSKQK